CTHCSENNSAKWRCIDCTLAKPICRRCMRHTHRNSPFHRIECWNGTHFRPAEQWEVGTYILVPHHAHIHICEQLSFQMEYLEDSELISVPNDNMPMSDALNNTYVRVVHINGIHHLAMVTCHCQGDRQIPLDLVAANLLPASFIRIRTLFTAQLLNYFRLCNLELKASAYQFYQLIRRLTMPMSPAEVINLYHEFRRMSRLWRWMKKLKWAGYGHTHKDTKDPEPGSLANFCPACPQPNVNLANNWKDDENRFVFRRMFVADGNFKADHVSQKRSDSDIWLWDGGGMFPNVAQYSQFLQSAHERLTVTPCETTFRALTNSLLGSKACDITGVVGIACARHGCYAPNALVNLFRGEQQKNVDFAFLQLKTTGVDHQQGVMLIYDIACQYFVHLQDRIGQHLPTGLCVDRAIGLFHVHAHKDECFFRFATSFIPGAGVVAGEILESLWSSLNAISPTVRTATLPHRAEMLDDHATDSNHKKLVGMTFYLCSRNAEASAVAVYTEQCFAELSGTIASATTHIWEEEVLAAEAMRLADVSSMDIYAACVTDQHSSPSASGPAPHSASANISSIEDWIELMIVLEEKQIELQDKVRHADALGADQQSIQRERETLTLLLLHLNGSEHGPMEASSSSSATVYNEAEFDDADEAPAPAFDLFPQEVPYEDCQVPPEREKIPLPSNDDIDSDFRKLEINLRMKQANQQLQQLRELISNKSSQYSHVIQKAPRKDVRTRGRQDIKKLNHKIALHARIYSRCRDRLVTLGYDQFRVLTKDDVKASTAILNPNEPGSSKLHLSWIWNTSRFLGTADAGTGADPAMLNEFKRVHWLRARAQMTRWQEELLLVTYEMQWTVRYFLHQTTKWESALSHPNITPGASAYASRQKMKWHKLTCRADKAFRSESRSYLSPLS
ncbi:hypothetical protein JOM56_014104, partial [Amanita muscaria]